jgi:protein-disulfide isomerase
MLIAFSSLDASSIQAVEAERDKAKALGLHSTPTFFVGDKQVVGSRGIAEELKKYFEEKK